MKYYLQRDTSDVSARYLIYDEKGDLKYTVTGKHNPSSDSIRIVDCGGETVCKIRGLGFSVLSVYSISSGKESMRLNITLGPGRASVRFRGISFIVRGDVLMGSYSILDADTAEVCTVGKDFAKGCTQLLIRQEDREVFCIASAICIDSLSVGRIPALQMS